MLMIARDRDAGDSEVSRKKAASVWSWLQAAEEEKALEGPEDLCPGLWARLVRHNSKVFPFLFLFSRRLSVPLLSVLLGGLTACAPFFFFFCA